MTELIQAIKTGNIEELSALIAAEKDINAVGDDGTTAMLTAVGQGLDRKSVV